MIYMPVFKLLAVIILYLCLQYLVHNTSIMLYRYGIAKIFKHAKEKIIIGYIIPKPDCYNVPIIMR